jgi:hypothetical protein
MRIYEIEAAAPYFEAGGTACGVAAESRERVVAECERPARLISRELFFDGWHATVNRKRVDIEQEGIAPVVAVPAGCATISFRYLPSYVAGSACLALLGVVIVVVGSLRTMRARNAAHYLPVALLFHACAVAYGRELARHERMAGGRSDLLD